MKVIGWIVFEDNDGNIHPEETLDLIDSLEDAKRLAIELCEEYLDSQTTEDEQGETSLEEQRDACRSDIESRDDAFSIDVDGNYGIHCRGVAR